MVDPGHDRWERQAEKVVDFVAEVARSLLRWDQNFLIDAVVESIVDLAEDEIGGCHAGIWVIAEDLAGT